MQAHGQWLRHRSFLRGHGRRDGNGLVFVDHQALPEPTLNMREPHGASDKAHVETLVVLAGPAIPACVAWLTGIHGDPHSRRHPSNFAPNLVHGASDLVPESHGLPQPDGPEATVVVIVEIRPADAAGLYPDPNITGSQGGHCDFFDPKVLRGMNDDTAHGHFLSS
jgi:hypothetical protein